eukprot:TRINITY_DN80642_c0_g1_i1.p1 TRINITY_DN80642_c0_g1~~TRINITY_DN80642_c0_g1_i1.p1  ORF type:complete len:233 (+),score=44.87 TRINITY_DN80642_c0_g1_i1:100-699(+)
MTESEKSTAIDVVAEPSPSATTTTATSTSQEKPEPEEAEPTGVIDYEKDFLKVQLRLGTIKHAEPNKKARHPAYKVWVDFGAELEKSADAERAKLDAARKKWEGKAGGEAVIAAAEREVELAKCWCTSAQIVANYPEPEALKGKRCMGVTNFPAKKIAGFRSEFLLCGFHDREGNVLLATLDSGATAEPSVADNGARLM